VKGKNPRTLYPAWHEHAIRDPEYGWVDFPRLLGVYSTQKLADAAVERARALPGFRESSYNGRLSDEDTFFAGAAQVGEIHWDEGFVEMDD
jgi:hypothetical protein